MKRKKMALTFYFNYMSQPCRTIIILCRMNNIEYEEKIVDAMTDTRKEWFMKMNPMRLIPVMTVGDLVVTESAAMVQYLNNSGKLAPHWYPAGLQQRARVDEYIMWHFCQGGIRDTSPPYFLNKSVIPMMTGKPTDPEKMKQIIKLLERSLTQMESYFMTRGDFIIGNAITIADVFAICELMQPISYGYDITKGRPRLTAWFDRVKSRLQPHFDDVHQKLLQMTSNL